MMSAATRRLRALGALLVITAVLAGVPLVLIKIAGWPFPQRIPTWERFTISVRQGDVPSEVVIKTLAVIVWIAWALLAWALLWEIAVNTRQSSRRANIRPAPLVPETVSRGAGRLVAILFSVGISVATTPTPTLARAAPTSTQRSSTIACSICK